MKTYWFTIADGELYRVHAERLKMSLEAHGIELTILAPGLPNSREAKHRKISGILDAPRTCDRIVYLDADTLVLDPDGIENVNGAWKLPWRIGMESCLPKKLDPGDSAKRLESFYRQHRLSMFAKNGSLEGVEWNSGVIAGNRDLMLELAEEWAVWWNRILDLFDGHFRRDQLSFRIAYHKICLAKNITGLPAEYNWIASYFGLNPNAHILHRTMVRNVPWLDQAWEQMSRRKLDGETVRTANKYFDFSGMLTGRPSLQRNTNMNREVEADLLRQTLRFCRPKRVLLCGIREDDQRFLPLICDRTSNYVCVNSLQSIPAVADLPSFELVVFCGVDYVIPEMQACELNRKVIFCFAGIHDMALYQHLYEFEYFRILEHGFGLFSHSPKITGWNYERLEGISNSQGSLS